MKYKSFMVFLTTMASSLFNQTLHAKKWTHNIKRIFIKCIILWLELLSGVWIFLIIHLKILSLSFIFVRISPRKLIFI